MTFLRFYHAFDGLECVERADERMVEHDTRTGVAHDGSYLFAHGGLIAMARALGAEILFIPPTAVVEPVKRIVAQLPALGAKFSPFCLMHAVTVDFHHLRQHLFFAGYSVFCLFLAHDNLPL